MLTLIGSPQTRGFRVLWMLEELNAEYELMPASPHNEEVLAVNPSGKVPALRDGHDIVIDSVAIVQYLADKYRRFTAPAGTVERAKQDSFTFFAVDEFDGVLWTNAKHDFALPEKLRCPQVKPACQWELARSMEAFAKRLGDRQYVMGDEFTVPDLIIGHCAGWMQRSGFDWPAGKLSDYFNRVRGRPAFEKAWDIRNAG